MIGPPADVCFWVAYGSALSGPRGVTACYSGREIGKGEGMANRKCDYPTGNPNGMSFIANRWVFTGPKGWRVEPNASGTAFNVVSMSDGRVAGLMGLNLSEDDAHAYAARLANTVPHPSISEGDVK